jgi:hypothetical protein
VASQLQKSYEAVAAKYSLVKVAPDGNVTDIILKQGEADIVAYKNNYIVAAQFDGDTSTELNQLTAIYNLRPYHASPLAANLITNTLLNHLVNSSFRISTTTHPMDKFNKVMRL